MGEALFPPLNFHSLPKHRLLLNINRGDTKHYIAALEGATSLTATFVDVPHPL
jgi:hypothetical protein